MLETFFIWEVLSTLLLFQLEYRSQLIITSLYINTCMYVCVHTHIYIYNIYSILCEKLFSEWPLKHTLLNIHHTISTNFAYVNKNNSLHQTQHHHNTDKDGQFTHLHPLLLHHITRTQIHCSYYSL